MKTRFTSWIIILLSFVYIGCDNTSTNTPPVSLEPSPTPTPTGTNDHVDNRPPPLTTEEIPNQDNSKKSNDWKKQAYVTEECASCFSEAHFVNDCPCYTIWSGFDEGVMRDNSPEDFSYSIDFNNKTDKGYPLSELFMGEYNGYKELYLKVDEENPREIILNGIDANGKTVMTKLYPYQEFNAENRLVGDWTTQDGSKWSFSISDDLNKKPNRVTGFKNFKSFNIVSRGYGDEGVDVLIVGEDANDLTYGEAGHKEGVKYEYYVLYYIDEYFELYEAVLDGEATCWLGDGREDLETSVEQGEMIYRLERK